MGKWDDDIPLQPPGTVQPTTVAALMRQLGALSLSERKKTTMISRWLDHNKPSETLINSLRRNGYSELLKARMSA